MKFITILLWVMCCELFYSKGNNPGGPKSFDCPMRQLALLFGQNIQPFLSASQLQDIADALNGAFEAKNCSVKIDTLIPNIQNIEHSDIDTIPIIYVDTINGIDNYDLSNAFKTLEHAIKFARIKYGPNQLKQILLKDGTYYLSNTIYITPNDNNLIIKNYKNDKNVIISGGMKLNCSWSLYQNDTENGLNYYQCDLNTKENSNIPKHGFTGLRINGVRAIRARYPNANPETDGFGSELKPIQYLPHKNQTEPAFEYLLNSTSDPIRNDTLDNWFAHFTLGINGVCDNFDPPAGYWCSYSNDLDHGETYELITGLTYNKSILPNTPYKSKVDNSGVINMWRAGHWSSWMFEIKKMDEKNKSIIFGNGGYQGARGGKGDEFYIENVFEELDAPTEWFYNKTTKILYYRNNITNKPPDSVLFEITNLKVLFNFTGKGMNNPVKNISMNGMTFKDAAITYLDPHGMPSGGDWALQRQGALYFDYTEDINIFDNYFTRMDGNVISINRYARNFTVFRNEFVWIGDSLITAWGDTLNYTTNTSTYGMGIDGTNGNQPRGLNISYNLGHEFGVFEKQSALFFNAKSCYNYIHNNIAYNAPRAAIEHNDGFGGGAEIYKNLLFNTCKESGGHGPFNSWDRQPYLTINRTDGTKTTIREYDSLYQNFLIGNYETRFNIDNDDGSCYYNSSSNFLVYGDIGLKGFTVSHDNHHYNNIYGYVHESCFNVEEAHGGALADHINWYFNNICVLNINPNGNNYGVIDCNTSQSTWPMMYNNTVYALNSSAVDTIGLCNLPEKEFQEKYKTDLNTQILANVNDSWLIQQARSLIFS